MELAAVALQLDLFTVDASASTDGGVEDTAGAVSGAAADKLETSLASPPSLVPLELVASLLLVADAGWRLQITLPSVCKPDFLVVATGKWRKTKSESNKTH